MANTICAVIFTSYAAHMLGATTFGVLSLAQIFVTSFSVLGDLGIMTVVVREVAQTPDRAAQIATNVLLIKLGLGILSFLITLGAALALGYAPDAQQLIILYALSLIPSAITSGCIAVFNGFERMAYSTIPTLSMIASYIGSMVVLWVMPNPVAVVLVLLGGSCLAACASLLVLGRYFTRLHLRYFSYAAARRFLVAAMPYGLISIISMAGIAVGPIVLSHVASAQAVGSFNAATKLITVFTLVIAAYNAAILPVFSRLGATSKDALQRVYLISTKIMLHTGLCVATGITVAANQLVGLIFPGLLDVVPALQILVWYSCFSMLATVTINMLYAEGRQREAVITIFAATAGSVMFSVLGVPRLGTVGVCLGYVILTGLQYALSYWQIARTYRIRLAGAFIKSLGSAGLIALMGVLLASAPIILIIVLMALVYIISFFRAHLFDDEEWKLLNTVSLVAKLKRLWPLQVQSLSSGDSK